MRTLRLIGFAIIAIVMSGNFVACGDDDEEGGNVDIANLVGLWEPIHTEGYDASEEPTDRWNEDIDAATNESDYMRMEFNQDGSYKSYYYDNGWQVAMIGKYKVDGNKIYISSTIEEEEDVWAVTIVSLNSNQLIFEDKDNENGQDYYEKITLKRIK